MKKLLLVLIMAATAAGGESDDGRVTFLYPAEPSSPPVLSMSQRFVFRGFDRRDGTRLSAWTEDIATRLERRMRYPIPFSRLDIIRIEGVAEMRESAGNVYVGQGVANGSLQQRIVVANPERIESEALLEGMVQVLLNRYMVAAYFAGGNLPDRPLIPDWFSVGMAQGLREDLRQRNLDYVLMHWADPDVPSATDVLAMNTLSAGRSTQKAYCGVFLDWLEAAGGGANVWPYLFQRFADDESVDGEWVAKQILQQDSARAVNPSWDLWLANKTGVRKQQQLGELGFAEVAALKGMLDIQLMDYGLLPVADLPERFAPRGLIEYKNESWARTIALQLLGKLQEARLGQAPELVAVIDQYAAFFAGFNIGERGSMSATQLSKRLDDAERSMTLLEKSVALKTHYFNNVERHQEPALPQDDSALPGVDDKRRSFLDEIENLLYEEGRP